MYSFVKFMTQQPCLSPMWLPKAGVYRVILLESRTCFGFCHMLYVHRLLRLAACCSCMQILRGCWPTAGPRPYDVVHAVFLNVPASLKRVLRTAAFSLSHLKWIQA